MSISTQKYWAVAFVTAGILAGGCTSPHPGAAPGSGGQDGGAAVDRASREEAVVREVGPSLRIRGERPDEVPERRERRAPDRRPERRREHRARTSIGRGRERVLCDDAIDASVPPRVRSRVARHESGLP